MASTVPTTQDMTVLKTENVGEEHTNADMPLVAILKENNVPLTNGTTDENMETLENPTKGIKCEQVVPMTEEMSVDFLNDGEDSTSTVEFNTEEREQKVKIEIESFTVEHSLGDTVKVEELELKPDVSDSVGTPAHHSNKETRNSILRSTNGLVCDTTIDINGINSDILPMNNDTNRNSDVSIQNTSNEVFKNDKANAHDSVTVGETRNDNDSLDDERIVEIDCSNEHENSVKEDEIAILDYGNADEHNLCGKRLGKISAENGEEPVAKKSRYDDKASELVVGTADSILKASLLDVTQSAKEIRKTDFEKVSSPAEGAFVNHSSVEKKSESSSILDSSIVEKSAENLTMEVTNAASEGHVSLAPEPMSVDEDCVSSGSTTSLRGSVPGYKKISKPEAESSAPRITSMVDSDDEDADDPGTPGTDSDNEDNLVIDAPSEVASTTNENEPAESAEHGTHTAFDVEDSIQSVASSEREDNGSISNPSGMPALAALRRGTLSKLTKSDLEELIVQKICECVTERTYVGELRRRIQTLENEAEKWKEKAVSCTKQVKELELVIKKFKSDCSLQNRDRSSPVTPVRVTRSVGLQVAIGAPNKKNSIERRKICSKSPQKPNQSPLSKPASLHLSTPSTAQKTSNVVKATPPRKQFNAQKSTPNAGTQSVGLSSLQPSGIALTTSTAGASTSTGKPSAATSSTATTSTFKKITTTPLLQLLPKQFPSSQSKKASPSASSSTSSAPVIDIDLTDDDEETDSPFTSNAATNTPSSSKVVYTTKPAQAPKSIILKRTPENRTTMLLTGPAQKQLEKVTTYLIPGGIQDGKPRSIVLPNKVPPPLAFQGRYISSTMTTGKGGVYRHPAPLPKPPIDMRRNPSWKLPPPRPALKISKSSSGIVLSWEMAITPEHEPISSYQIVGYQEGNNPPSSALWKKVGDVQALPLPMACTLTHFVQGHKYHFAVRAVDVRTRVGPFSAPGTIFLVG